MTLKLGRQHWMLEYYHVCSNGEPGLTLTHFTARSNYAFVWEKSKTIHFSETIVVYDLKVTVATDDRSDKQVLMTSKQKVRLQGDSFKLATNDRSDKMFLLTSKFRPQEVVSPCSRAIYIYKIMKKMYIIKLERDVFETCSK